ncbi:MAG: acetamidase/formamidase family protein [Holophagales bacterium]|nr:acetamidase/formamidase family protein [Holophagales bacterium]
MPCSFCPQTLPVFRQLLAFAVLGLAACAPTADAPAESDAEPSAEHAPGAADPPREELPFVSRDQTHNKLSRDIPPVLRVASGTRVRIETEEASDAQLHPDSTAEDLAKISFDPIHPLSGPIYVEGAEPGDVLKVTLDRIEIGEWGWTGIFPGFGYLPDRFTEPFLKTFRFEPGATDVEFSDGVRVPLRPFPGVIAVAPDTSERLSTIPPRANGGNMDDKDITVGTVVYLPVFVRGALFSIGDAHAAQGDGEVCGTAIEAPMELELTLEVLKGVRPIPEPQYERDDFYAVTAFGETLDQAAVKATHYMVDYLEAERGLDPEEAYALASVAADLKIAEVVDLPHVLVTMKIPKSIFVTQ